jgi:hypothetical protein
MNGSTCCSQAVLPRTTGEGSSLRITMPNYRTYLSDAKSLSLIKVAFSVEGFSRSLSPFNPVLYLWSAIEASPELLHLFVFVFA